MLKKFWVLTSLVLSLSPASAQDFWQPTNIPYGGTIYSLAINSSGHIFAGTYEAGAFRSINNGDSWTQINTGLAHAWVLSLSINSSGHIFAGTAPGAVFRSTDNGDNWIRIDTGLTKPGTNVLAISANGHMFAGGYGGVFRSTDNGYGWTQINTGLEGAYVFSLAFNSSGDIFAGIGYCDFTCDGGGVFRSTDNGDHWTDVSKSLTNPSVWTVATGPNGYIFAGTDSVVFRSTDNGQNWSQTGLTGTPIIYLAINSSGDVFAGTYGFGVFRSTDNGDNWMDVSSGLTNLTVWTLAFNPSGYVFAGTDNGVFRSVQMTTAVEDGFETRPKSYTLSQNYPNPFNPATTIRYFLPKRGAVTLEIFNLAGQRVKVLAAEEQTAGEHVLVWDGRDLKGNTLPSGLYLYRLTGKDFSETKKMIFLK